MPIKPFNPRKRGQGRAIVSALGELGTSFLKAREFRKTREAELAEAKRKEARAEAELAEAKRKEARAEKDLKLREGSLGVQQGQLARSLKNDERERVAELRERVLKATSADAFFEVMVDSLVDATGDVPSPEVIDELRQIQNVWLEDKTAARGLFNSKLKLVTPEKVASGPPTAGQKEVASLLKSFKDTIDLGVGNDLAKEVYSKVLSSGLRPSDPGFGGAVFKVLNEIVQGESIPKFKSDGDPVTDSDGIPIPSGKFRPNRFGIDVGGMTPLLVNGFGEFMLDNIQRVTGFSGTPSMLKEFQKAASANRITVRNRGALNLGGVVDPLEAEANALLGE